MESILYLVFFCFLFTAADYRITEYSVLEVSHKDHQDHLLSGWSMWQLNPQLCVLLSPWCNQLSWSQGLSSSTCFPFCLREALYKYFIPFSSISNKFSFTVVKRQSPLWLLSRPEQICCSHLFCFYFAEIFHVCLYPCTTSCPGFWRQGSPLCSLLYSLPCTKRFFVHGWFILQKCRFMVWSYSCIFSLACIPKCLVSLLWQGKWVILNTPTMWTARNFSRSLDP